MSTPIPGKAKVLFVDDEERIVSLLKMVFRSTYEVYTATSGKEALEIIKEHTIHVIVTDQRMPEMLGIELLALVKQHSPNTMRLLLTGYSDVSAIIDSVNEGEVYRFIHKPWNHEEIKATLADAAEIALRTAQAGLLEQNLASEFGLSNYSIDVLVLDDNSRDQAQIIAMLEPHHTVHGASSIAEALKILEKHDVGVLVSEARVGTEDTGQMLRLLKQHYPLISTVMLTDCADCDLVVKLINEAQIYRFALKPARPQVLQLAVSAAMKNHGQMRANPVLMARYKVMKVEENEAAGNGLLGSLLVKSLSALRSRFSFFKTSKL